MSGAEQLSEAVLESGQYKQLPFDPIHESSNLHCNSDPEVVRAHHDLSAQMSGRKDRLSFLIKFINDNSVLTKVCLAVDCWDVLLKVPRRWPRGAVKH